MTTDLLPQHEALHVISDIHMGGKAGFQILRETARLAGYVSRLAAERPGADLALVLNGDIFDTLAEDGVGYIAVDNAASTVARIIDDPSFKAIWDALAHFVHQPKRTLVLVIGNHDIELAFPTVQRLIVQRLAQGDELARSRIMFSVQGAGYGCVVGGARVYCTHGNEVDAWNYTRYEDLGRAARRLTAAMPFDLADWRPNAGTRMVKEVMNAVKQRYRWIDLLKPENSAAVGTLMAIDPAQMRKIGELLPIVGQKSVSGSDRDRRLSADSFAEPAAGAAPGLEQVLGPNLSSALKPSADDMLLQAERDMAGHAAPMEGAADQRLGTGGLIWDRLTGWITGVGKDEALRRAIKDWLKGDKTFEIDNIDETCVETMKNVGSAIDIVVTGHTHLERAIALDGGRHYFNSGTWIRLMRFTDEMLADNNSFKPVYELLLDGSMSRLDGADIGGKPLILDATSEVQICAEGGRAVGRLNHVTGDGSTYTTVAQLPKS